MRCPVGISDEMPFTGSFGILAITDHGTVWDDPGTILFEGSTEDKDMEGQPRDPFADELDNPLEDPELKRMMTPPPHFLDIRD